jgi:hypothetical protein
MLHFAAATRPGGRGILFVFRCTRQRTKVTTARHMSGDFPSPCGRAARHGLAPAREISRNALDPRYGAALKGAVHEFQITHPGCALLLYIRTSHALLLHPPSCDTVSNSCEPRTSLAQLRTTHDLYPPHHHGLQRPPDPAQALSITDCCPVRMFRMRAQGLSSHPHPVHQTPSINASRIASIAATS